MIKQQRQWLVTGTLDEAITPNKLLTDKQRELENQKGRMMEHKYMRYRQVQIKIGR